MSQVCRDGQMTPFIAKSSFPDIQIPSEQVFCGYTFFFFGGGGVQILLQQMFGCLGFHLSNEQKHGCLGYIGEYTTQFWGDYNKPSYWTTSIMESKAVFFRAYFRWHFSDIIWCWSVGNLYCTTMFTRSKENVCFNTTKWAPTRYKWGHSL